MKTRKGTIDARPKPGALFTAALQQFEEAVVNLFGGADAHPMEIDPLRVKYNEKRQALVDYVVALETR